MTLYYCYDAYCGWCYGFSPVIMKIAEEFEGRLEIEVLSGGMIPAENARPVSAMATFVRDGYKRVEELTGIKFGKDFLWHMNNPEESDWFPHSEKAAIALCIFKELKPRQQVEFATDLQYALNSEGRDLTDNEAYRHLLTKYELEADDFYRKIREEKYKEMAHYEFACCRQLQVTGFPALLVQSAPSKFYLAARGYTSFENVKARLDNILKEVAKTDSNI